ncbi:MAG: 1-phosphofructokinase family hexose kinase [Actinobacteria bacterium]|nr:1-phosphofructokinase family hexose kinase [Actinomycetota bacterium]
MILIVTPNPCIDKTIYVKRNELGKIIRAYKVKLIAGGKGNNVARVLNNMGIENLSLNLLGGYYGKIIEECLRRDGINYKAIWIKNPSRTVVTVLEDSLRQTAFVEPGPEVLPEEKEKMLELFKNIVELNRTKIRFVILSGSIPDHKYSDIYRTMIEVARLNGIKCVLDSRGKALKVGVEAKPFLIKPNIQELEDLLDLKLTFNDLEDDVKLAWYALELTKYAEIVILTMGDRGSIVTEGKKIYKASPPKIEVINPVGSGDSFLAGFVYGLYLNMDIVNCIKIATAAGAANASIWDAASCTKEQIMQFVDEVEVTQLYV